MKYFQIKEAYKKSITGIVWPQCLHKLDPSLSINNPYYLLELNNESFFSKETQITFELDSRAKATDFLSQSSIFAKGYLIN